VYPERTHGRQAEIRRWFLPGDPVRRDEERAGEEPMSQNAWASHAGAEHFVSTRGT
jgi:hypothetical protein